MDSAISSAAIASSPHARWPFLSGGGEMGERIRAHNWTRTPLGSPDHWPGPLRTVVRVLLTTDHPAFIFWGPEHICLYNDAYGRSLGPEKHPSILGAHGRKAWDEIWSIIGPQIEHVMAGHGATWHENSLVPITRHGQLEQVYWTYGYSPIDDPRSPSGVGGVLVLCTETTAQVRVEQQLRATEHRWRTLFDQAPGFVCVLQGPEHRFEYANERYFELVGRRDLIGRTVVEIVPEAAEQQFVALLDRVYRSGEVYRAEAAPILLDRSRSGVKEVRHLDFVYQPVRNADGQVSGIFVVGYDVSNRKRMEDALSESERRLQIGLDSARGGVYEWSTSTGEVHWTAGHFALLALDPEQHEPSYKLWRRHLHPDDVERVENAIHRCVSTGERYSEEYRIVRADGEVRWVHGQGLRVSAPGEPARLVGALIDIHERRNAEAALRKSEQRFRRLADEVPSSIWMTNATGCMEFANRYTCEFVGSTLAQVQAGCWQEQVHPDDRERLTSAMKTAMTQRARLHLRIRVRNASGQWRHLEPTGIPRINENGVYCGHVGISPDITDMVASHEMLREAGRRKDEFLATLSHELRNPLAPIRSAARLLRTPGADPQACDEASQIIDRQVSSMAALLDDLLDISRITRGTFTLSPQRVTLAAIIEAALEVTRPLIDARGHRLVTNLPAVPVELDVDPLRFSQAVSNLLTNAVKYTDPGGTIDLSAEVVNSCARIVIRDSGIGLAEESIGTIFGMFSQVKSALDRSEGGLGIGLALVKGIVELHGGSIEVSSAGIGRGSEFRVSVPIAEPESDQPAAKGAATDSAGRRTRRMLVVDDSRDGAESLAMLLELYGHEVAVAFGGEEAIERARSFRPDVVLLDIGMPDLNGYEVARQLRLEEWGRGVTLIALTGWGQAEDKRRAAAAGFDLHLTKPIDPDALQKMF